MKIRILLFITAFVLFSGVLPAWAALAEDGDAGFWLRTDMEKKIDSKWKLSLGEELRFRENAGLFYADTHAGVSWQASDYLSLGGEYLQIRQTRTSKKKDIWFWEARPRFHVTPQIKIKDWKLEDRNMLELRVKEEVRDSLRYRQRIMLTAPWKWTPLEIQPQIFDEMFFETHRNGMTENRLFCGVKVHFWKPFYGTLGYIRQTSKSSSGGWRDSNVFSFALKGAF